MIRGLWVSARAMTPLERAQEMLANNLANSATGGFRQDRVAFHSRLSAASEQATMASEGGETLAGVTLDSSLDLAAGPLETTQNRLNLALSGPGFFVVQGPEGDLYTRDGSLQLSPNGTLLHRSGYPILGEGGAITVPPGGDLTVAADGSVFVDGTAQGKLRVVALPDPTAITHAGSGLMRSLVPGETDTVSRVVQGALEGANVDPVSTMVDMMTLLRGFEADQKAILTQDSSLGRLIQWAAG